MSSITGVSSSYSSYGKIASGNKLQSASDGAAELAIAKRQNTQITGYNAGRNNMQSGKEVLNISDGAMGSVNDYLQRIRELALQASNTATVSDSDRKNIQQEIDQMKQGITDVASKTQYNTQNLLDGTKSDYQMATDGNGSSTTVSTANATLESLGIADFDVTGDFDLKTIDDALSKVSSSRSSMGAKSNALDYAINYNAYAAQNLTGANSRLEDLDYPKAISDQKKEQVLQNYSIMMQRKQRENEANTMNRMFT